MINTRSNLGKYNHCLYFHTLLLLLFLSPSLHSAQWSNTEMQWQYGSLDAPTFAGGGKADTSIITLQHASGWEYGSHFFFIDFINDNHHDGYNDQATYAEYYGYLSWPKLTGKQTNSTRTLNDFGLILGANWAANALSTKYLPGIRLSWNIAGFAFINTDLMLLLDDSKGVAKGGAPKEENGYLLDINFSYPWQWGDRHQFSIDGHIEYATSKENEFGDSVADWILVQPQLRYDLGHAFGKTKNRCFVGIEGQFWNNKLGDKLTDESELLFLAAWRF